MAAYDLIRNRLHMAAPQKKKSGPEWLQRLKLATVVTLASAYIWLLRLTCRIDTVSGSEQVDAALARGVVIPCSWHQHIMPSALFLRDLVPRGLKTGFLTSPSRDGEFTAGVARRHGTWVMRGSSSRTGRQALKALIRGVEQGISPTIYPDGTWPGTCIQTRRHHAGTLHRCTHHAGRLRCTPLLASQILGQQPHPQAIHAPDHRSRRTTPRGT